MGRDGSRYALKPFDSLNVFWIVFFIKAAFSSGLDERKRLKSHAPSISLLNPESFFFASSYHVILRPVD